MTFEAAVTQARIEAEGLVLRPLRRSDEGLVTLYAGDRRVAEMTPTIPHPYPPGAAAAFIDRVQHRGRDEDVWAIDGSPRGLAELVGMISLKRLDREQSEVGYWVAPAFWNLGVASAAVQALVAANPQRNKTIFASVFQDNPASARVLTNAGFEYLGDAETYSVARGAPVPTWTYLRKLD
jgi:RimJ/RimL family protein N-acetyltransferase